MTEKNILRVSDVMNREFLMMDGLATVAEALREMKARDANFVLIAKRSDDDEYGIVMAADIAKKVLAVNSSPDRTNIYEIMSKPVLSVEPDMHIRYCARLFDRFGISTAPVINDRKILGVVSYDTLVLKGLAVDI
jgi:predicted transcriptional regulator